MIRLPKNATDADRWRAYSARKSELMGEGLPFRELEAQLRKLAAELGL